jgi:hypothetical protein
VPVPEITMPRLFVRSFAAAALMGAIAGATPAVAGTGSADCTTFQTLTLQQGRWAVLSDGVTAGVPIHCWSFTVGAGFYVWAYVEPSNVASDSVLRMLSRSPLVGLAPTLLEEDDNDGEHSGSAIAGRLFTRSSQVFVRVSSKTGAMSYRLNVFVTSGHDNAQAAHGQLNARPSVTADSDLLVPGKVFGVVTRTTPAYSGFWLVGLREGERIALVADGSPMTPSGLGAVRATTNAQLTLSVRKASSLALVKSVAKPLPSAPSSLGFSFVVPAGGGDFIVHLESSTPSVPFILAAARMETPDLVLHTDLRLSLEPDGAPYLMEQPVTHTYRVHNQGSTSGRGFALRVRRLDPSITIEGASGPCREDRPGVLTCPLPTLLPGQSWDILVRHQTTLYTDFGLPRLAYAGLAADTPEAVLRVLDVAPENDVVQSLVVNWIDVGVTASGSAQRPGDPVLLYATIAAEPRPRAQFFNLSIDVPAPLTPVAPAIGSLPCTFSAPTLSCVGSMPPNGRSLPLTFTFAGSSGLAVGSVRPFAVRIRPLNEHVDVSSGNDDATASAYIIGMPTATDADGDGLSNLDEEKWGLDPNNAQGHDGPGGDPDGDGIDNATEIANGTHPRGFHRLYFAEGATGSFFDQRLALLNTAGNTARVLVQYLRPAPQVPVMQYLTLLPASRATIEVETIPGLEDTAVSAFIESDVRLVADRTMSWDARGYGAHAETAVAAPATTWYFAEGSTAGAFSLFYLLQNPGLAAATVTVRYLRPAPLPAITKTYTVDARSRFNIWVNQEGADLASTDVSAVITSSAPIIAERAMYLDGGGLLFRAGHDAVGLTAPALEWYLAEGATGPYFDLFVLLANPTDQDAQVEVRFLKPDGTVITRPKTVPANARSNIWVDVEDPALADTAVSTTIRSTNGVPILVERAMWWPGSVSTWHEAHAAAGVTTAATRWALAEGEVGGPRGVATYILVANTSPMAQTVNVALFFENGTSMERTFDVPGNSRFNVDVGVEFPGTAGARFGAIVTASLPASLIVERAMYWDAAGARWAAGTSVVATPIP